MSVVSYYMLTCNKNKHIPRILSPLKAYASILIYPSHVWNKFCGTFIVKYTPVLSGEVNINSSAPTIISEASLLTLTNPERVIV
jgi:hypothetical protein